MSLRDVGYRLLYGDPTAALHPATKNYVDTGGGVVNYGTVSGTINPTLIPQQSYTIGAATTINQPPTAGVVDGQSILTSVLGSGATYVLTIGTTGSPARMGGYPASLQIPSGKNCVILWRYSALTSRYTVMYFIVEQ